MKGATAGRPFHPTHAIYCPGCRLCAWHFSSGATPGCALFLQRHTRLPVNVPERNEVSHLCAFSGVNRSVARTVLTPVSHFVLASSRTCRRLESSVLVMNILRVKVCSLTDNNGSYWAVAVSAAGQLGVWQYSDGNWIAR